jgi:hypothetical protein
MATLGTDLKLRQDDRQESAPTQAVRHRRVP